jgi:hypothetical protein
MEITKTVPYIKLGNDTNTSRTVSAITILGRACGKNDVTSKARLRPERLCVANHATKNEIIMVVVAVTHSNIKVFTNAPALPGYFARLE